MLHHDKTISELESLKHKTAIKFELFEIEFVLVTHKKLREKFSIFFIIVAILEK